MNPLYIGVIVNGTTATVHWSTGNGELAKAINLRQGNNYVKIQEVLNNALRAILNEVEQHRAKVQGNKGDENE